MEARRRMRIRTAPTQQVKARAHAGAPKVSPSPSKSVITYNGKSAPKASTFDFLDLGASKGGSFQFMQRKFQYSRGLGIDIDPAKVAAGIKAGVPMLEMDATNLAAFSDNCCETVSMLHFLEHLPDMKHVEAVLKEAVRVASKRIYIKGPPFHDAYLESLGLRYFWAHWVGHSVHVEGEDIVRILKRLGVADVKLTYLHPVETSDHPCIQSTSCAIDRFEFDANVDPAKPQGIPLSGAFREFEVVAHL